MYHDQKSKRREELEKEMNNMTEEQKKSSLKAPFWNDKAKVDSNTPFMKKVKKIYEEANKENK